MFSSFFRTFYSILFVFIFLVLFILCFFLPVLSNTDVNNLVLDSSLSNFLFQITSSELTWPTPGYTNITSPFGNRDSPTSGASTSHSGIDIGAPAR